jgi:hypothetical protein
MESQCNNGSGTSGCKCPCSKMLWGLIMIVIGVLFLLKALGYVDQKVVDITWPALLIIVGLKKLCGKRLCKYCMKGDKT